MYCRILLFVYLLLVTNGLSAQSFDAYRKRMMKDFNEYKERKQDKFKEYRDKVNADLADYIAKPWEKHTVNPAIPAPTLPEPPTPDVKDPDSGTSDDLISFEGIIDNLEPRLRPEPFVPIDIPEYVRTPSFTFDFYGSECGVPLRKDLIFRLRGIDEKSISDAWKTLSSGKYLPVVYEALCWREDLNLCDWGYIRFLDEMTKAFFPEDMRNEATLMQVYILTQSGYMVRMARTEESLALLLPFKNVMYDHTYLNVQGRKYYVMDKTLADKQLLLTDFVTPKEQMFSLRLIGEQIFAPKLSEPRDYVSKRYPELSFRLSVNENLIRFYDDYPLSNEWNIYSEASLSSEVKTQLYPELRGRLAGKDQRTAANMLLDFVQTAFKYKTDVEQFGKERAFFADETFFYRYSDCEDRAILYSVLVRELLGLDVVLLHYPLHLATAVRFDLDVVGDHIVIDGVKYTVCDPTYIGAPIGDLDSKYKRSKVKVIKIQ